MTHHDVTLTITEPLWAYTDVPTRYTANTERLLYIYECLNRDLGRQGLAVQGNPEIVGHQVRGLNTEIRLRWRITQATTLPERAELRDLE